MSPSEIKNRIDLLNDQLEQLLQPNKFTLNNLVVEVTAEIDKLQSQCEHEYVNNFCIYCYKMRDNK
jgi:hypothetical protein